MNSSDEVTYARSVFSEMLRRGVQIKMYWDAGGDETPVRLTFDGKLTTKDGKAEDTIIGELIDKLSLPGAGEEYNAGSGELFLSPEGAIGIRYTAYDHEWGGTEIPAVEATEDDPFNFYRHVNKGMISFQLVYRYLMGNRNYVFFFFDKEKKTNVDIAPDAKAYYTGLFDKYLDAHLDKAGKAVDSGLLETITHIEVHISFPMPQRLHIRVSFSTSNILNATKDELILL